MEIKEAIFKLHKYRERLERDFEGTEYGIDAEPFDMAVEALEKTVPKFPLLCLMCKKPLGTYSEHTMMQCGYTKYSYCEDCLRKGLKLLKGQKLPKEGKVTVRNLIETHCDALYITTMEDPERDEPEIWVESSGETDVAEMLSEKILDSEVHLMTVKNGALHISLFWNRR